MQYKSIFIDSPTVKSKGTWGMSLQEVNGDQLARDVNAAIEEAGREGYELQQTVPVHSSMIYMSSYPYSFTSGILLVFRKMSQ